MTPVGGAVRAAFDHAILTTSDPEGARNRLLEEYGLGSVRGGSHPWGTANWIVPLEPPTYLEILYVEDRTKLAADPEGASLLRRLEQGDFWSGWALRPDDVELAAAAFGFAVERGQATRPTGEVAGWRVAFRKDAGDGLDAVPFLIQYDNADARPQRFRTDYDAAGHRVAVGAARSVRVVADGPAAALLERLHADVDIRIEAGPEPGIRGVGVDLGGEVREVR